MKAWIRMPLELLQRQGLSKSAAIVLGLIIDRCTDTADGVAAITQAELANESGYDPRTIRRALIELRELDLIELKRTGRGSRYRLTGCVELLPPKQRGTRRSAERAADQMREAKARAEMEDYLSASIINRMKEG